MSVIKEDTDDLLIQNVENNECQAGFTEGRRIKGQCEDLDIN